MSYLYNITPRLNAMWIKRALEMAKVPLPSKGCNHLAITPLFAAEPLIARSIEGVQEHQSKAERSCSDLVNKLIHRGRTQLKRARGWVTPRAVVHLFLSIPYRSPFKN